MVEGNRYLDVYVDDTKLWIKFRFSWWAQQPDNQKVIKSSASIELKQKSDSSVPEVFD